MTLLFTQASQIVKRNWTLARHRYAYSEVNHKNAHKTKTVATLPLVMSYLNYELSTYSHIHLFIPILLICKILFTCSFAHPFTYQNQNKQIGQSNQILHALNNKLINTNTLARKNQHRITTTTTPKPCIWHIITIIHTTPHTNQ